MLDVSFLIPARNEEYLEKTIKNVLENIRGNSEVIAVLDGYLPDPQIHINDNRVKFLYYPESIGQRKAINEAAKVAKGKYICKLDAHCAIDEGFDIKMMKECKYDWTLVGTMYNLDHETWKPKLHKKTNYMYIGCREGRLLRAEYYEGREKDDKQRQPKNDKMVDETMCCMGPCFFMHTKRFWELGGCDEGHGGWGQQGVEVACKAWLSGGALMVNKNTWFAHQFRGGSTGPGFPWPASGKKQEVARKYSRDLWINNKWDKQTRKFEWLINKFNPPKWNTDLTLIYYTANQIHSAIESTVLRNLKGYGYPIISVSQKPMNVGTNIVVEPKRSYEGIYEQLLTGAKAADTEYIACCEDDCLYTREHFSYRPTKPFAYNLNRWNFHLWVREPDKQCFARKIKPVLSQCIAHRETLIKCLEEGPRTQEMGLDGKYEYETFETKEPHLNFCHRRNLTGRKFIDKDADVRQELPPYQNVEYWLKKFKKRGLECAEPIKMLS